MSDKQQLLDFATMDSQSRAFEGPLGPLIQNVGTPPRCYRAMLAQPIVALAPGRLAVLFVALISAPLQIAPAILKRRRA